MGKKAEKNKVNTETEKKNAQDSNKNNNNNRRKIITDPRFSTLHTDPRFQKYSKHQSKVTIDSRFIPMFTDKNFASSTAPIDKRGKPKPNNSVNLLRHYYKMDEDEEEDDLKKKKNRKYKKQIENEEEEEDLEKKKNNNYKKQIESEEEERALKKKKNRKYKKQIESEDEDEEGLKKKKNRKYEKQIDTEDVGDEDELKKNRKYTKQIETEDEEEDELKKKKKNRKYKKQIESEDEEEDDLKKKKNKKLIESEDEEEYEESKKNNNKKYKKQIESKDKEEEEGSEDDIGNEDMKNKLDSGSSDAELSSEDEEELELLDESKFYGDNDSTNSDTDDENDFFYSDEESEELEEKIPEIDRETHRLAIVNMDWSQIRAVDLYVVMNSFLPEGGEILSVSIYPSDFGLKRMEEESLKGPIGLFDSDKKMSDDEDNDEIDNEKLRSYEKSRLRYFFAVVECDSITTADYIYKTCDGIEVEKTSNVLDLRFIPDTMQFEHPPRDVATEVPTKYEAVDFHTQALQQSKIRLTWDEDEPTRAKILKGKWNADELDKFQQFLPSEDEESSDDDDNNGGTADGGSDKKLNKVDTYRALIEDGDVSDGNGSENDNDMEVTFNTGLEDISKRIVEKNKDKKSETVWEATLRKQKEKKKARKYRSKNSSEEESSDSDHEAPEQPDDFFLEEPLLKNKKVGTSSRRKEQEETTVKEQEASRAELELLLADDQGADHNLKGYNLKPKKAKGKKGKELPAEEKLPSVDYDDSRFSAMFKSPLFALDPTDAQYKRSAAYARHLVVRQQKGLREESTGTEHKQQAREALLPTDTDVSKKSEQSHLSSKTGDPEFSSLVRSLKRKAQQNRENETAKASTRVVPMRSKKKES